MSIYRCEVGDHTCDEDRVGHEVCRECERPCCLGCFDDDSGKCVKCAPVPHDDRELRWADEHETRTRRA